MTLTLGGGLLALALLLVVVLIVLVAKKRSTAKSPMTSLFNYYAPTPPL
jgi:hypothetical protein